MPARVGEFYLFCNPETSKHTIGKATSIKDSVVFFDAFVLPEELALVGHKSHHSKYELIKTDEKLKEFESNVIKKVHVLR
mmetsp:Transcript_29553/g.36662  ORF Transcript_29553/g.36662 Transcript_29553/m.36662 type:complete len:80 (-) Transcript_29553:97-336(-)